MSHKAHRHRAMLLSSSPSSALFAKKFTAMAIGNVMEWFDFAAFGAFADVIGQEFFPNDHPAMQLLKSMAVFGAAFIMRPLGSALCTVSM